MGQFNKHLVVVKSMGFSDELDKYYWELAKKYLIPGLKAQKNKNFTLGLIMFERNYKALGDIGFPYVPIIVPETKPESKLGQVLHFQNEYLVKFVKENKFHIQSRLDLDNWIRDDYIENIHKIWNKAAHDSIIIQALPIRVDINKGVENKLVRYNKRTASAFITLCQKNIVHDVFAKYHHDMIKFLKVPVHILPHGFVKDIIHGKNFTTIRSK